MPQDNLASASVDERDPLAHAVAQAVATGDYESAALCDATEVAVHHAKANGHPPERVVADMKARARAVNALWQAPLEGTRRLMAWVIKCAVRAYYGLARP